MLYRWPTSRCWMNMKDCKFEHIRDRFTVIHTRSSCIPAVRATPKLIRSMSATEYRRPSRGSIFQSNICLCKMSTKVKLRALWVHLHRLPHKLRIIVGIESGRAGFFQFVDTWDGIKPEVIAGLGVSGWHGEGGGRRLVLSGESRFLHATYVRALLCGLFWHRERELTLYPHVIISLVRETICSMQRNMHILQRPEPCVLNLEF